ncbi:hypothetical protein BDV93DRAFT_448709, partial [Ceratobasidium sp. AG-I]
FCLRAFLITCFGDMPAIAKLMCMKGHGGKSPCRACCILDVREGPDPHQKTNYVPLSRTFDHTPNQPRVYDGMNLPRRSHAEFVAQAVHVGSSKHDTEAAQRSRITGINVLSPLARLSSIDFPRSFPHDFMHVMFENVIPGLLDIWTHTGKFSTLSTGYEDYVLHSELWEEIGKACANSGDAIPSAFGCRIPNLHDKRSQSSSESNLLFATLLAPALLRGRFKRPVYYQHFMKLVRLINLCIGFEVSRDQIGEIRRGFAQWVKDYERYVPWL